MAVPFVIPAQSILTESAISAGVGATSLTGGFPWGARPPPFCVYPGIVGTATPATAGSWPHPSVPPAPIEDPPFLCKPLRLVQLDSMFIVAGCQTAYSATVRSAAGVPRSALTVLTPCDRTTYPQRWAVASARSCCSTTSAYPPVSTIRVDSVTAGGATLKPNESRRAMNSSRPVSASVNAPSAAWSFALTRRSLARPEKPAASRTVSTTMIRITRAVLHRARKAVVSCSHRARASLELVVKEHRRHDLRLLGRRHSLRCALALRVQVELEAAQRGQRDRHGALRRVAPGDEKAKLRGCIERRDQLVALPGWDDRAPQRHPSRQRHRALELVGHALDQEHRRPDQGGRGNAGGEPRLNRHDPALRQHRHVRRRAHGRVVRGERGARLHVRVLPQRVAPGVAGKAGRRVHRRVDRPERQSRRHAAARAYDADGVRCPDRDSGGGRRHCPARRLDHPQIRKRRVDRSARHEPRPAELGLLVVEPGLRQEQPGDRTADDPDDEDRHQQLDEGEPAARAHGLLKGLLPGLVRCSTTVSGRNTVLSGVTTTVTRRSLGERLSTMTLRV